MPEQTLQYPRVADTDYSWLQRLRQFPGASDVLIRCLRTLGALSFRAFLHSYLRLKIVGREHLPKAGSFVLVANHASHLDALCLLSALPFHRLGRAYSAAAQDYFFRSFPREVMAAIFLNAIPFARRTHTRQSLDLCRRLLAQSGNILILFPEGTRTLSGRVGEFRDGVGFLVAGTDIPVIPCALQGAFTAWPKGARFPRPRALRLIIGAPRRYSQLPQGRGSSHHIATELRDVIGELLCQ